MSKPIARVVLAGLIGLVLVAAAYMTVQGGTAKADSADTAGAQAHVVSGLQTNLNHDRSTVSELEALQARGGGSVQKGGGHGCESERHSAPLD